MDSLRTPDLGGILGDTFFWFAEGISELKLSAREGGFGGVPKSKRCVGYFANTSTAIPYGASAAS